MVCYICSSRGVNKTNAGGICVECSKFVCIHPSSRKDGIVHAEGCSCACNKLVCELDHIKHSRGHAPTLPSPCFSAFALTVSTVGGIAAATLLQGDQPATSDPIDRFVRTVAPGAAALRRASATPSNIFESGFSHLRKEAQPFRDEFFSDIRLRRIVTLAAWSADRAARHLRSIRRPPAHIVEKRRGPLSIAEGLLEEWGVIGFDLPDLTLIPDRPMALARWLLRDSDTDVSEEQLVDDSESDPDDFEMERATFAKA